MANGNSSFSLAKALSAKSKPTNADKFSISIFFGFPQFVFDPIKNEATTFPEVCTEILKQLIKTDFKHTERFIGCVSRFNKYTR